MRSFIFLAVLLSLFNVVLSLPTSASSNPLPLIIWHGLGDRYNADGLKSVSKLAAKVHPGTYVYNIRLDDDGSADSRATFFGNLTAQISSVCDTLSADPILNSTRIDALGFSQGGQFLRGLIQTCPAISIRSLVTFGSQHNGIAQFQACGTFDLLCKGAVAAIRGNAWSEWVQSNIVPAQYYREKNESTDLGSETYLNGSRWLADVNNERTVKSEAYKERLAALEKFAMYVFELDTTVLPKESGWFAEVNTTSEVVTPLRERIMYREDWLGLKKLDQKNGLVFRTVEDAKHMQLTEKVLKEAFKDFFGPERRFGTPPASPLSWRWQNVMSLSSDW